MIATAQAATQLTVTVVKGKVTYMTGQGQRLPLEVGDIVDEATVINIPFHGSLEMADRSNDKKYSINAPGRAPVSVLLKDNRNSVEKLTKDYIKSTIGQLTGNTAVKGEVVTQPAAITRKMETVKKSGFDMELDLDMNFDMDMGLNMGFTGEDLIDEYRKFRTECLQTYANFFREAWKSYSGEDPLKLPEVKELPPQFIPVNANGEEGEAISYEQALADGLRGETVGPEESTSSWFSYIGKVIKRTVKNVKQKIKKDRPMPVDKVHDEAVVEIPKEVKAPIPVSPVPGGSGVNTPFQFNVFGTDFQVRLNDECRFKLRSVAEDAVADAIQSFSDKKYDNLLYDCLKIRRDFKLSDWAYYQVLKELTDKFCGKGTNEATLLLGYLYSQSGYKLRLGRSDDRLLLLLASQHTIFNKVCYKIEGDRFYVIDSNIKSLSISNASFPNETGLSLAIADAQKFNYVPSPTRTIQARHYPDFKVTIHTNDNLMSFYDTYLRSTINDNVMTQWSVYANTPISDDVREELYPQLHAYLDSKNQVEAVDCLLNLIQTGMPYEYDDKIWGRDRVFFPDETLYYPYCDCEDRAILLSRLVRDILGLKTILIYYPGHLAMAVGFTEPVKGDYILYNGVKYVICDPTYIAADPGKTMDGCDNSTAQVILLE